MAGGDLWSGLTHVPFDSSLDRSVFSCPNLDLNDFFYHDALKGQQSRVSATHCVLLGTRVVGFFTLVNDTISTTKIREEDKKPGYSYSRYPALKIARLATDTRFQRQGIGTYMLYLTIAIAYRISHYSGCKYITVDSKRESALFYEQFGFIRVYGSKSDTPGNLVHLYLDYMAPFTRPADREDGH